MLEQTITSQKAESDRRKRRRYIQIECEKANRRSMCDYFGWACSLSKILFPKLSVFVKTLSCPNDPQRSRFTGANNKRGKTLAQNIFNSVMRFFVVWFFLKTPLKHFALINQGTVSFKTFVAMVFLYPQ